jgi:branched-chain amino acid transport system ATP-binding protein
MTYLKVEGLTKYFGGLGAVQDLDFEIYEGETIGLVGPNGSGKTTVFNMIGGDLKPTRGRIVLSGENIVNLSSNVVASKGVGRMFQTGGIFPDLSVLDNMIVGGYRRQNANVWSLVFGTVSARQKVYDMQIQVQEILEYVGLAGVMKKRAGELARGKQRFLSLGMILIANPPFWMLDEPVGGMTAEEMTAFIDIVNRFKRQNGTTVIMVDHNMKFIMENCSRIIVLHYGRKIAEGTPDEISSNSEVIRVYLGSEDVTV